ncbi:hypothetical protein [uncultured Trichococcus sp.]|uniref:hypothetical protein n=1 Tax=uncultured Trichococcus sp. TaxID=189665 RepID=UPI002A18DD25|nr:hypothetical protein [uncultured Trichococcus sp.]
MKKTSENMQRMYAIKRESTLKNIQEAIDEIQGLDRIVTKKELIEITGLSSGTFSQEYVKELLKKNKVCQFKERSKVVSEKKKDITEKKYEQLLIENEHLRSKMQDFEIVMDKNNQKYTELQSKFSQLDYENKLLKGKYQQLLEYLNAIGVTLDSIPMI